MITTNWILKVFFVKITYSIMENILVFMHNKYSIHAEKIIYSLAL